MILTRTADIGDKIRAVLKRGNGRRIAIVAFVGRDACKFIGDPKGLEVYCWPNGAATNPDGIRDLQDAGAKVYFVDRLHMKLFWSERGGYVIGSPNLSNNALDDTVATNLLESASYGSDSGIVPLDAILQQLKRRGIQEATAKLIGALEDEYFNRQAFRRANRPGKTTGRVTFEKYLASSSAMPWSYVTWGRKYESSKRESEAASRYNEEHSDKRVRSGSSFVDASIQTKLDKAHRWVLEVRLVSNGDKIEAGPVWWTLSA
ncbi:MAG: phospholipase D-like domain-containing protein [Vulcanimicrobiaceae bacterium]